VAFTEEAKANRLYIAYAIRAAAEGHPQAAEVFLEVSGAETAHALEHLRALGEVGSTRDNLRRVIQEEMSEASVMYPRMIRQAEREGRQDAVRAFQLAFEAESRHAALFRKTYEQMGREPVRSVAAPIVSESSQAPVDLTGAKYQEMQGEKQRVAGLRRIREVVFGAQDGLISTVAIAATVMAATGEAGVAILAGLASALAGTVSMAAGTYLGSRATSEMEQSELARETRELVSHPDEERAELVATFKHDGYSLEEAETIADRLMLDRELALQVMAERELGISPETPADPRKDAAVMAVSYIVGGIIPLSAYALLRDASAIPVSMVVTTLALAAVGAVKARTAHRAVLPSILEVTVIGAAAGMLGYALGEYLPRLLGGG
jgi:VIT1/CCC1 family predicted Fe2+/Mn2+ transporter